VHKARKKARFAGRQYAESRLGWVQNAYACSYECNSDMVDREV
jgi:hypothetical protein